MVGMDSDEVPNMVDRDEAGASVSICLKAATTAKYRGADGLSLSVPAGAGRKALQKLIHHLLQLSKTEEDQDNNNGEDADEDRPDFHFLADNEPLRTTLGVFLTRRGRSREETVIVTYYIPLPIPRFADESKPSPNWLSSISAREMSNPVHNLGDKTDPGAIAVPLVLVGSYSGAAVVYRGGAELVGEDACSKEDGRHNAAIKAVAWASDLEFVTASLDQTVRFWSMQLGSEDGGSKGFARAVAEFRSEEAGEPVSFHSVATTGNLKSGGEKDAVRIAAGGEDGSIWVLHTAGMTRDVLLPQNGSESENLRLGKRRRTALGTLAATRVGTGTMRAAVTDLQWTREDRVISSSLDGFLRVWDTEACTLSTTVPCGNKSLMGLSIARDLDDSVAVKGKVSVVVGAADGGVRVIDAAGSGMIAACGRKGAHNGVVNDVVWIHADRHLASSGVDGSIRLWDIRAMAMPVRVIRDVHGGQACMAVDTARTSRGHSIYSVGADGRLVTLELDHQQT